MSITPDQAHAALNAAELTPDEMHLALVFLAGWTPDGLRAAVSSALCARKIRSITAPDIPPPFPPPNGDRPLMPSPAHDHQTAP